MNHQPIDIHSLNESAVRLIGKDWMLITAGTLQDYNTMTAAWGGLGFLWKRPVAYIFVRPHRHTYLFTEKYDHFSLCFFGEKYREALQFCGTRSGRDTDKAAQTGLEPLDAGGNCVYFSQAELVLICRKIYYQDLDPQLFLDQSINKEYPGKDYHRMYIGEIETTLVKSGLK